MRYAQQRYGRLGRVTLARTPLLHARDGTMTTQAFGISINGRRLEEAVVVREGGFTGFYQGVGIADVHKVSKPRGNKEVTLPTSFNDAVIYRVRGRGTDIEPKGNTTTQATITSSRGQTQATKGFGRFVIMDAGNNPMQPQQR